MRRSRAVSAVHQSIWASCVGVSSHHPDICAGRRPVDLRAALDSHRARTIQDYSVHALMVADSRAEPALQLTALVRDAAKASGLWVYTDILRTRDAETILNRSGAAAGSAGAGSDQSADQLFPNYGF